MAAVSSRVMPSLPTARVTLALSGGVDSSVAALLMSRCVHTLYDLELLFFRPLHRWDIISRYPCASAGLFSEEKAPLLYTAGSTGENTDREPTHTNGHLSAPPTSTGLHTNRTPPLSVLLNAIEHQTPWSTVVKKEESVMAAAGFEREPFTTHEEKGFSLFSPMAHQIPVSYHPTYFLCWGREDKEEVSSVSLQQSSTSFSSWCAHAQQEYTDAELTAHQLGVLPPTRSLPTIDLRAEYHDACFLPLLNAYARGHTFNVDVECNTRIKFGAALRHVLQSSAIKTKTGSRVVDEEKEREKVEFPFMVTGHYARMCTYWRGSREEEEKRRSTRAALVASHATFSFAAPSCFVRVLAKPYTVEEDPHNDQVHFLARVDPTVLSSLALFPIGHLFRRKADVRQVATHFSHLLGHVAQKKTSTGICMLQLPRAHDNSTARQGLPSIPSCAPSSLGSLPPRETAPARPTTTAKPSLRFPLFLSSHMGEVEKRSMEEVAEDPLAGSSSSACRPCAGTRFFDNDRQEYLDPNYFSWSSSTLQFLQGFRMPGATGHTTGIDVTNQQHRGGIFLPAYALTIGQKLQYMRPVTEVDTSTEARLFSPNTRKKKPEKSIAKEPHSNTRERERVSRGCTNPPPCRTDKGSRMHHEEDPKSNAEEKRIEGRDLLLPKEPMKRAESAAKRKSAKSRIECVTYYVCEKKMCPPDVPSFLPCTEHSPEEAENKKGTVFTIPKWNPTTDARRESGVKEEITMAQVQQAPQQGENVPVEATPEEMMHMENPTISTDRAAFGVPPYYSPLWLSEAVLVAGSHEHPALMHKITRLQDIHWHMPVRMEPNALSASTGMGVKDACSVRCSRDGMSLPTVPSLFSEATVEGKERNAVVEEGEELPERLLNEKNAICHSEDGRREGTSCWYSITCLCAVRHQDRLQLATLRVASSPSSSSSFCETGWIHWRSPKGVRCPAAGQLVVMYLPPCGDTWVKEVKQEELLLRCGDPKLSTITWKRNPYDDRKGCQKINSTKEDPSLSLCDSLLVGPCSEGPFAVLYHELWVTGSMRKKVARMESLLQPYVAGHLPLSDLLVLGSGWVQ